MVRIFGDTTCGLTLDQAKQAGIEFIPQIVVFGDESYRDDYEIDCDTFVKKLEAASELPKTAAPPPALYTEIYKEMAEKGDSAIVICPSSLVSGTVRSAETAKGDFPNLDVRVIDTHAIGSVMAMMILEAKKMADAGKTIDEIEAHVLDMSNRSRLLAYVDTLEYLYKGGRIGGAAKLVGNAIQLRPILTLRDGQVEVLEKKLSKKRALSSMFDLMKKNCAKDPDKSMISLCMLPDHPDLDFFREEIKNAFGVENVPNFKPPSSLMVHAGPNIILLNYFTD